jgi:predicted permease
MKAKWNEFVVIMGYLFLVIGVWMVLFGGHIQLGNPLRFFE